MRTYEFTSPKPGVPLASNASQAPATRMQESTADDRTPPAGLLVPTLIALLAGGVLAAGALAAAVWRGVDALERHEAERRQDLRAFHAGLLDELHGLAEQSGMLNSADLCLVRFRVHRDGDVREPILHRPERIERNGTERTRHYGTNGVTARLFSIDPSNQFSVERPVLNGQLRIGLIPPAAYRLELTCDGYQLRHDFDVLPGVPVDRLVLCPRPAVPADTSCRIEVRWPDALADRSLAAVCEVERDVVTCGAWTWQPVDPQRAAVLEVLLDPGMPVEGVHGDLGVTGDDLGVEHLLSAALGATADLAAEDQLDRPFAVHLPIGEETAQLDEEIAPAGSVGSDVDLAEPAGADGIGGGPGLQDLSFGSSTRRINSRFVYLLLSERSSYLTGDCLTVDGGQWLGKQVYGQG